VKTVCDHSILVSCGLMLLTTVYALGLKRLDTFNVACYDFLEIFVQDLPLETGFLFF
jgi:hypothetical protein